MAVQKRRRRSRPNHRQEELRRHRRQGDDNFLGPSLADRDAHGPECEAVSDSPNHLRPQVHPIDGEDNETKRLGRETPGVSTLLEPLPDETRASDP